jgi:hypothetical protein
MLGSFGIEGVYEDVCVNEAGLAEVIVKMAAAHRAYDAQIAVR